MNKKEIPSSSVSPNGGTRKKSAQRSDTVNQTPKVIQLRRSARNNSPAMASKTTASNFTKNLN